MNQIKIFENPEFGSIRTVEVDGKPYFVANDIAAALGYKRTADAVTAHCKGSVKRRYLTGGGEQEVKVIPEGDVYRLIVRSKLPAAEKFEAWVFDEVLPSIRKSGGYIAGQEQMSDSELMAKALLVAQKQIDERNAQIERMKPKEIFADAVSASQSSILVGELAKILKQNGIDTGQKRLFSWLRENGYLIRRKGSDYNMPTQKSMNLGLFEIKESTHIDSSGCNVVTKTPKVTGYGQQYFANKFLAEAQS